MEIVPVSKPDELTPQQCRALGKDLIEKAMMEMIAAKMFSAYVLLRMDVEAVKEIEDSPVQTACLMYKNNRFYIKCVYDFMSKLTSDERIAVLEHEVSHFINKHTSRRNGRDDMLYNIAADMAINQSISNMPKGSVTVISGFEKNQSAEYYYDELLKMSKKQQKGQAQGQAQGQGQNQGQGKSGQTPQDSGQTPQNSGKSIPEQWDAVIDASVESEGTADSMADEICREIIKERINAGDDVRNMRGLYAGALEDYIDDLTKPPMLNWKTVVSRFATSLAQAHGRMTLKRPDRRGLSPYGKKKEYMPSVVVCVDTSGSVSDEMLAEFFSQIRFLGKMLSQVHVVIADAQVHESFEYRPGCEETLRKAGKGRGGTDFDPAIQYINKELLHCDGVIYLTDGWCPVPATRCKRPVIWIVTQNRDYEGRPQVFAEDSGKVKGRY